MRALVIGASGGIGAAMVRVLKNRGDDVTTLSRRDDGFDVTDEASVSQALQTLAAGYELVLVATGALSGVRNGPEKALRAVLPGTLAAQFALNAAGPLIVLKHALRLLPRDRTARFAALSARVGSIGDNRLGGWYSYRAAKAALNQLIRTAAVEVARSHPLAVLALLHPGTVDTPFTEGYQPAYPKLAPDASARALIGVLEGLTPAQSGGFFDHKGHTIPW
jgi:NAD(P)-dependent dehydrogenase (short-subunit alcohol dehydrogenase family)